MAYVRSALGARSRNKRPNLKTQAMGCRMWSSSSSASMHRPASTGNTYSPRLQSRRHSPASEVTLVDSLSVASCSSLDTRTFSEQSAHAVSPESTEGLSSSERNRFSPRPPRALLSPSACECVNGPPPDTLSADEPSTPWPHGPYELRFS
jgi:hypothetical protein